MPLLVKHQIRGKSREVKEKSAFVYRATFPVFDLLWLLFGSPSFCLSLSSPLPQIIFLLRDPLLQALFLVLFLDWSFLNAACYFLWALIVTRNQLCHKEQLNLYLKTRSLRETSFDTYVALIQHDYRTVSSASSCYKCNTAKTCLCIVGNVGISC